MNMGETGGNYLCPCGSIDESSGQVVSGSKIDPVKFEE
jgi:hypothetical protein